MVSAMKKAEQSDKAESDIGEVEWSEQETLSRDLNDEQEPAKKRFWGTSMQAEGRARYWKSVVCEKDRKKGTGPENGPESVQGTMGLTSLKLQSFLKGHCEDIMNITKSGTQRALGKCSPLPLNGQLNNPHGIT